MELNDYIDDIKLRLTGGVLDLEISDETIGKLVKSALRIVQRYCDSTVLKEVPFASCIDLSGFKHSSVVNIYASASGLDRHSVSDPFSAQTLIWSNGYSSYNLHDYVLNYAAFSTIKQITNQTSKSLAFFEDKSANKLYINEGGYREQFVVIEYIPKFEDVNEVVTDYWIDILLRLSLALVKQTLGKIRSRFTNSSMNWEQDGQQLTDEGNQEYSELLEVLRVNKSMMYPVD